MKSFKKFLEENDNSQLRELARYARTNLLWTIYDDKYEAQKRLAAIIEGDDATLNKNQKSSTGGLKKWLYDTLFQIEENQKKAFSVFLYFLETLQNSPRKKCIITKRTYLDYLNKGAKKCSIEQFEIEYVFSRALEENILTTHNKKFKIN